VEFSSSDIARITKGVLFGRDDIAVSELATDSRQINIADNVAFIAIKGQNHDGHEYINTLYLKGIRVFLVSTLPPDAGKYQDSAFIVNEDTIEALQSLAAFKRSQ
jgi:alanine racemase